MSALHDSDVHRSIAIDLLYLDLSTCQRCQGTDANLDRALQMVEHVVSATGTDVTVRKIRVDSLEQARELRFLSSPTIRVNGGDIAFEVLESECGSDACDCAPGASCRMWRYRGEEYSAAPVGLIVDVILAELYGGASRPDPVATPYEAPDNLVRIFSQPASRAGGCCA